MVSVNNFPREDHLDDGHSICPAARCVLGMRQPLPGSTDRDPIPRRQPWTWLLAVLQCQSVSTLSTGTERLVEGASSPQLEHQVVKRVDCPRHTWLITSYTESRGEPSVRVKCWACFKRARWPRRRAFVAEGTWKDWEKRLHSRV